MSMFILRNSVVRALNAADRVSEFTLKNNTSERSLYDFALILAAALLWVWAHTSKLVCLPGCVRVWPQFVKNDALLIWSRVKVARALLAWRM
jgi:hypothetical protein